MLIEFGAIFFICQIVHLHSPDTYLFDILGKGALSQKKHSCVESFQHGRESEPLMTAGGRMTEAGSEHPTRGYTKE
jgi:hypothetical protein